MPSKHISAYRDIERVLDTALRHDTWPVTYSTGSEKAAIRWRARANSFRTLLRTIEEERLELHKGSGSSIYDDLIFRISDSLVIIERRPAESTLVVGDRVVPALSDEELLESYSQEEET